MDPRFSHYNSNFRDGLTVGGLPLMAGIAGKILFVDSNTGGDGNSGRVDRPFATLGAAIDAARANKGDLILVREKHAETITGAGGITVDKAGLTIIGLGRGNQRPRFLMDGGATVTAAITAAGVTLQNLIFAAGHADIVAGITVAAQDVSLLGLEFVENVATENFLSEIKATSTTDGNASGLTVVGCRAISIDASGLEFIEINADLDRLVACNNFVSKDAATAAPFILCATGKDLTNCLIEGNRHVNGMTANDLFIDNDTTANSGIVAHNLIGHHDAAGAVPIDLTGARIFQNYAVGVDDASGLLLPAVDDNA